MNTLTTIGIYRVGAGSWWNDITNKPVNGFDNGAGIIEVKGGSSSGWVTQYIHTQGRQVWFRCVYKTNSQYNSVWQILSNFGCNTPNELASLLGGLLHIKVISLGTIPANSKVEIPEVNTGLVYMNAGTTSSSGNFYHIGGGKAITKIAGNNDSISLVGENDVIKYQNDYSIAVANVYVVYVW